MKNNFQVFVLNNNLKSGRPAKREHLIKSAAVAFGVQKEDVQSVSIGVTPKGKPFFEQLDMHFSISHSDDLWACLMGPSCCGLDVQYIKPCNYKKIAGRFFSKEEAAYVDIHGIDGFFQLWVRREAFCKLTGEGFFSEMPALVSGAGFLKEEIRLDETRKVRFHEIILGDSIKAVACVDSQYNGDIIVREDWQYEDYISIR